DVPGHQPGLSRRPGFVRLVAGGLRGPRPLPAGQIQGGAKAQVVVPVRRVVPVAVRRPAVLAVDVPAAAPDHPGRALGRARPAPGRAPPGGSGYVAAGGPAPDACARGTPNPPALRG